MIRHGSGYPPHAEETDVGTAAFNYAGLLGWPVTLSGSHLAADTGSILLAVEMPAPLGRAVQHLLRLRMQDGPVIEPPGRPEAWVFLTTPYDGGAEQAARRLDWFDAHMLIDQPVLLPPSDTPHGRARWLTPPSLSCPWLPPFTTLAAALQLSTEQRSC